MNKQELITAMAEKAGLTKKDAEKALKAFEETVTEELVNKGTVQLVGFGVFKTSKRASRKGRNPKTGEAIEIAGGIVPKFVAGKALKDAVK